MGKKLETKYILRGEDKTKPALRSVQKGFKKTESAANGITSSLKNMIGPLLAIASIGVIVRLGKDALDSADHIAKMSIALNISTEALSQYHHVAGLAGVETAKLENAFQKMNKNVSDAADGFGLAKIHLKKLNLDVKALHKLKADEKFEVIADAIMGMANASDRAAAAGAIWGERVGAQLLPLIKDGSIGIKEMREEADKLNLTLSATDAKRAEDAIDSLQRLTTKWEGFKRALIFSDEVKDGLNWFTDMIEKGADILERRAMDEEIKKITDALIASGDAKKHFGKPFPEGVDYGAMERYAINILENRDAVVAWGEALNDIPDVSSYFQFGRVDVDVNVATGPFIALKKIAESITMEELSYNVGNINRHLKATGESLIKMDEYQMRLVDGSVKWVKVNRENIDILKEYQREVKKLYDQPPPGKPTKPEFFIQPQVESEGDGPFGAMKNNLIWIQDNMPMLLSAYDQYLDMLQEAQIQAGTLEALNWALADSFAYGIGGSIDVVGDAFGMLFENMVSSEKQMIMFGRALKRMFAGIIADLTSLILKAIIANLLLSALGLTGAGLTGIKGMFQSSIAAMGGIDLEKRATGGSISSGQSYMVGERGPEIFTAGANGFITPNDKFGGSTTIHNDIKIYAEGNLLNDPLSLRRVTEAINDELNKVQETYYETQTV